MGKRQGSPPSLAVRRELAVLDPFDVDGGSPVAARTGPSSGPCPAPSRGDPRPAVGGRSPRLSSGARRWVGTARSVRGGVPDTMNRRRVGGAQRPRRPDFSRWLLARSGLAGSGGPSFHTATRRAKGPLAVLGPLAVARRRPSGCCRDHAGGDREGRDDQAGGSPALGDGDPSGGRQDPDEPGEFRVPLDE